MSYPLGLYDDGYYLDRVLENEDGLLVAMSGLQYDGERVIEDLVLGDGYFTHEIFKEYHLNQAGEGKYTFICPEELILWREE